MKEITYTFKYIEACNMCGAPSDQFKILGRRLNGSQGLSPAKKTGITTTIVRCKSCGLVFANPIPIPNNILDHYGVPPEEYWIKDYFTVQENYFIGVVNWLKKLKDVKPGMKSLDIGAGIGKQMVAMNRFDFDAYGLEGSQPFYERAISKMGIAKEKLQLSTIEDAEYEPETFDFISFSAVLEHLYDPSLSIKKALKWLKPDGLIHIEVPNANWLVNRMINTVYKLKMEDYVGNISPMHAPFHLYEFSDVSFKKNAALNNYKVRDYEFLVCKTYMPRIIDPIIKKYMKETNTGMQLVMWLGK